MNVVGMLIVSRISVLVLYASDLGLSFVVAWSTYGHRHVLFGPPQRTLASPAPKTSLDYFVRIVSRLKGRLGQRQPGVLIPTQVYQAHFWYTISLLG
jgi:hypothetical protein